MEPKRANMSPKSLQHEPVLAWEREARESNRVSEALGRIFMIILNMQESNLEQTSTRFARSGLGGTLKASWYHLGSILWARGGFCLNFAAFSWHVGSTWSSWGTLRPSWEHLGPTWDYLGFILGAFWAKLKAFWDHFGSILWASWEHFCMLFFFSHLGAHFVAHFGFSSGSCCPSWTILNSSWAHLGLILGTCWPKLELCGTSWSIF